MIKKISFVILAIVFVYGCDGKKEGVLEETRVSNDVHHLIETVRNGQYDEIQDAAAKLSQLATDTKYKSIAEATLLDTLEQTSLAKDADFQYILIQILSKYESKKVEDILIRFLEMKRPDKFKNSVKEMDWYARLNLIIDIITDKKIVSTTPRMIDLLNTEPELVWYTSRALGIFDRKEAELAVTKRFVRASKPKERISLLFSLCLMKKDYTNNSKRLANAVKGDLETGIAALEELILKYQDKKLLECLIGLSTDGCASEMKCCALAKISVRYPEIILGRKDFRSIETDILYGVAEDGLQKEIEKDWRAPEIYAKYKKKIDATLKAIKEGKWE